MEKNAKELFHTEEKKIDISISEIVFLAYFAVMLGAKAIGLYEGQLLYNICLVFGAALFGIKLLLTKNSILEYLVIIFLVFWGSIVYLSSGEKSLLIFFTMMLGMKNISVERVFKTGAVIWTTAFISLYVLSIIGVIPEIAYMLDRAGWPPILRHALGYPHPNTLHIAYFILCVFILYSCKNLSPKYITAISAIMMFGNCYVFMYSLSRNGLIITTFYLLLQVYFLWRKQFNRLETFLLNLIFPISATFLIVLPLIIKKVNGDLFEVLNRIFAGRFIFSWYFLTYKPMELFGIREIPLPTEADYVIDSSYVYLLFKLGIIAYLVYFVVMILLIRHLISQNYRAELAVVLALSFGGMNETYLFNQSYKNFIFLFLGFYLYKLLHKVIVSHVSILTEEKLGLDIGTKIVFIKGREKGTYRRVPVNIWAFVSFLFLITWLIVSIAYAIIVDVPQDIYLPENETLSGRGEEVYLSSEDVEIITQKGDIVRGYVDENTPLFRIYRKGTAKVEYIRYFVSYGLWGASIVTLVFLSIWIAKRKVRFFLRNRSCGEEYKENVLIVHNYYRIPGGEDIVVANEKALLESKGHKVVVYSRNNSEAGDGSFIKKIKLAFVSIFNIRTYIDIYKIIEKEKIDVIHVHNTVALISPAVYLVAINCGIPVVQTIHNFRLVCPNGVCYINDHVCERCLVHGLKASLIYNCYRSSKLQTFVCALTMKIQRLLLTYRAINYICLTEFNKEKILTLKQIKEENIYIKPNFTTLSTSVIPYEKRKRQIVYAGRIEKIKGIDVLLQAWMKLGDKAPELVICGSGNLESWCNEYISNNEIGNVRMLGQVSNEEAKQLVGESMAIIYPTQWYEGFPMAIAEAYTMGTPILAADIGNVGKLVDEGVSGFKFKSNSAVSLAKTVEKFMEAPIRLPDEYRNKYTAENNYKILKQIYEDVRRKSFE